MDYRSRRNTLLNLAPFLARGDPDQGLVGRFLSGLPGDSAIAI
jgi:hypothetical protein